MGTDLETIEVSVTRLEPEVSMEDVLASKQLVDFLLDRAKAAKAAHNQKMIDWMQTNKQDIVYGTVRYYVGNPPKTECTDVPGCIAALLDACGGDFMEFVTFLSSGCIRYGEARKKLGPEVWANYFKVTTKPKLEEGVAKPQLQCTDDRFVKSIT